MVPHQRPWPTLRIRLATAKGQRVLVDGRLQISRFQHKDGSPGVGFDVWADQIQNVSGRIASDVDSGDPHLPISSADEVVSALDDEDLPF